MSGPRAHPVALRKLSTKEALSEPHDRRSHWRTPQAATLFMQLRAGSPDGEERRTIKCESADLSRGGLRIVVGSAISVGAPIEAWIKIQGAPGNFYLTGTVRWCNVESPDRTEIGVALRDAPGTDYKLWRRMSFSAVPLSLVEEILAD
jgi:PilZ domain